MKKITKTNGNIHAERERLEKYFYSNKIAGVGRKEWIKRLCSVSKESFELLYKAHLKTKPDSIVIDVGAGTCPYKPFFEHANYITTDFCEKKDNEKYNKYGQIDYICRADELPFKNDYADTIINTGVLEHVPEPQKVINEFYRVLKKGGELFLTAPLVNSEHQVPYDYFRYTQYGLKYMFEKASFKVIEIRGMCGTLTTLAIHFLPAFLGFKLPKIIRLPLIKIIQNIIVPLCYWLDKYDKNRRLPHFYACHLQK